MATTTGKVLRQRLSERMGDYEPLNTSSAGNAAKTSLIDTGLRNLPGGDDEDFCRGWYVLITDSGAAADGESRRVASYSVLGTDGDSPTIIVGQPFTGGQIESGIDYELHRFDPALKKESNNRALRLLWSTLYLPIRDENTVVDDILLNGNMEDWNSANTEPDNWTLVNSPTVTRESSTVFRGSFSAKMISSSGSVGQLTQAVDVNLPDVSGRTVTVRAQVKTDGATQARLILEFGTATENGDYHTGDNEWQRLSVSRTIPTDATEVTVKLEVVAGTKTAYFDHVYTLVGPVYKYTLPTTIVNWPSHVTMQYNESDVVGQYFPFKPETRPIAGRILRFEGMGILSQPATDTDTTEIGEPHVGLVTAYAEMLFWRQMANPARSPQQQRDGYLQAAKDAGDEAAQLALRLKTPRMGATILENQVAHFEQDSDGKYLILDGLREGTVIL